MEAVDIKNMLQNRINTLAAQKSQAYAAGDIALYNDIELMLNQTKINLAQQEQIKQEG